MKNDYLDVVTTPGPCPGPEPTILDTLERCMQQARVLETQGRELYEMMMKTVFRVRGQQETRNGNDTTDSH